MKALPLVFAAVMATAVTAGSQEASSTAPEVVVPAAPPAATAHLLGNLHDGTPPPPSRPKPEFVVQPQDILSATTHQQGGYVRWKQDDEAEAANRYSTLYRYDASNAHDSTIGEPTWIRFKYDMSPISPGTAQGRSDIQIHPDGECTDSVMAGTAGCIGIQAYDACMQVDSIMQRFHCLKVKVQLQ